MIEDIIHQQTLTDLKILLAVACCLLFSPYLAKFLRLPTSAMEIILGSLIATFGFTLQSANFELLAKVGFYYLMFMAGMKVNLRVYFTLGRSFFRRTLLYIVLLYALSGVIVYILGVSPVFIIILPVMSVGLLSILFKEFGKNCEWLNTAMLVAIFAEVISIVLLTIVGAFLHSHNALEIGKSLVYLFVFLILCWFGFKALRAVFVWYPNLRTIIMPWQDKDEKDIRFCMGIFILIICAMIFSRLEIALGAFIAGAFIATFFNHKKDLEHKLAGFGFGFLIPIFFIYIGSTFDLNLLLDLAVLESALFMFFAMLALRLCGALVFLRKFGAKNTLLFALSHSMPLTLLIATATLSYKAGIINHTLYSALILTALLEAVLVMSAIRLIFYHKKP